MAEDQPERLPAPQIVATAGSAPEAEMICQILAAEGIPAMQQRLIDNPEFGQAGPRSVLVKASDLQRARDALAMQATPPVGPPTSERGTIAVQKRSLWEKLPGRAAKFTDRDADDQRASEGD